MKKLLLFVTCFAFQLTVHAQLKVHSNGNVSISNNDSVAFSPLSIGFDGDSAFFLSCEGYRQGLWVKSLATTSTFHNYAGYFTSHGTPSGYTYGVRAEASNISDGFTNYSPMVVGVLGTAKSSLGRSRPTFGVYGKVRGRTGAGICGQIGLSDISSLSNHYAGLFIGQTLVDGDLGITGAHLH